MHGKKYDTARDRGSDKVKAEPPDFVPTPDWQPFPGFSYLFNNPGPSQATEGHIRRISMPHFRDPELGLYKALSSAVMRMDCDELSRSFQFFALPPSTYHVTVWDGLNQGNITSVAPDVVKRFHEFFDDAINSSSTTWPPLRETTELGHDFAGIGKVRLKFSSLVSRGTTVLVAELQPADQESREQLEEIEIRRSILDQRFANYGKRENYSLRPHVAIGYFAKSDLGNAAIIQRMDVWRQIFQEEASEPIIEFSSIDLYAFTDMVTYFTLV